MSKKARFHTVGECLAAIEEVRSRLGLRDMVTRVAAKARPYDEEAVFDPAYTHRIRPGQRLRFGPDNELFFIEVKLREAETALARLEQPVLERLVRAMNLFDEVLQLEEYLAGNRARAAVRAGGSRGGRVRKRRDAIYRAVLDYLNRNPEATNNQAWGSFPVGWQEADMVGDGRYSVYREDRRLFQADSSRNGTHREPSIYRATFNRYMTAARRELKLRPR